MNPKELGCGGDDDGGDGGGGGGHFSVESDSVIGNGGSLDC